MACTLAGARIPIVEWCSRRTAGRDRPLHRMHPENLEQTRDKLTGFLSGRLGGPRLFSENYGSISISSSHGQWPIDEARNAA